MGGSSFTNEFFLGFTITVLSGLFIILIVGLILSNKKKKSIVFSNSRKIKTLLDLNKATEFKKITAYYSNHQICNSKKQLDHFSIDNYLISLIDTNENFYRSILNTIMFNREKWDSYIENVNAIPTTANEESCRALGISLDSFLKLEQRIFKKKILTKPICEITIYCKATYTSPRGRNYYYKDKRYNYVSLQNLFNYAIELKEQRQTRQYQMKLERAKMSDSLRYDILKRDNFKCQICGLSSQDGVKLHVDHIIPVAKGGKTIESNLRVLCDRCNMGKSDKI